MIAVPEAVSPRSIDFAPSGPDRASGTPVVVSGRPTFSPAAAASTTNTATLRLPVMAGTNTIDASRPAGTQVLVPSSTQVDPFLRAVVVGACAGARSSTSAVDAMASPATSLG